MVITDEQRLRELAAEWDTVNRLPVAQWETQLDALAAEAAAIKAAGQWRTGSRTLLEVLGVHELERKLVTCLAWVLAPEGHHGLGNRVVKGLFAELHLPCDPTARVRVTQEEARFTPDGKRTPADLIVRVGGACVLFEAKVNAGEHGDQCKRLARLWANESPVLVYLTRDTAEAAARAVPAGWEPLTWRQIADLMTPLPHDASAGARDFLETLQMLHGE